ncbi:MAG: hypothetical protein ABIK89_23310 [Planctomycetota bacterium]
MAQKLTAPEQVKVLQGLSQAAAAWLVGLAPRTFRDHLDAPRDTDGTYNAAELLKWACNRMPRPELTDSEYERALVIVSELVGGITNNTTLLAVAEWLRSLREQHGDTGLALFGQLLTAEVGDHAEPVKRLPAPSAEEQQRKEEARRQQKRERLAWRRLHIAVRCEECGRLRRGRQWVEGAAPDGYAVQLSICPACESKRSDRK